MQQHPQYRRSRFMRFTSGPTLSLGLSALALLSLSAHGADRVTGRVTPRPKLSPTTPAALQGTCEALAAVLANQPNTSITGASTVAAGALLQGGQPVAEHCLVTGRMAERVSAVDGKSYAVGFQM